jgi:hypothetical protein
MGLSIPNAPRGYVKGSRFIRYCFNRRRRYPGVKVAVILLGVNSVQKIGDLLSPQLAATHALTQREATTPNLLPAGCRTLILLSLRVL